MVKKSCKNLITICASSLILCSPTYVFAETSESHIVKDSAEQIKEHMWTATKEMSNALMAQVEGNEEKRKESLNSAIFSYDAILKLNPDHVEALNGRGICKEEIKEDSGADDLQKAIDISTSIILNDSSNANAFHDRATAFRSLKKFDEARADYNKAIDLYKPDEKSLIDLKSKWKLDLRAMELEAM